MKQSIWYFSFIFLDPGVFQFTKPSHICKESVGKAQIEIERVNGADGKVEVPYRTKDQSALHGKDYLGGEGVIVFDHNETVKMLEIDIIDDHMFEKDETFMVELGEIDLPGAKLGRLRRTVVTIVSDEGEVIIAYWMDMSFETSVQKYFLK